MPDARQDPMTFVSRAPGLEADAFVVTSLEGAEEIGRPYRFEIGLLSRVPDLDLQAVLAEPATLGLRQGVVSAAGQPGTVLIERHGVLASFEQTGQWADWTAYRAVLVPPLWALSLGRRSRAFLGKTVPEIVAEVLAGAGLTEDRFRFLPLSREYPKLEYVVQFGESDLDFVHRWLEHEGLFYRFEHVDGEAVVVFGDAEAHAFDLNQTVAYRRPDKGAPPAPAGPEEAARDLPEITEWTCRQVRLPGKVVLADYDGGASGTRLEVGEDVVPGGAGAVAEFRDHFAGVEEGKALARVRAEEFRCRARTFAGRGTSRAFAAGGVFGLRDHPRAGFNGRYLLTRVSCRATQSVSEAAGNVQGCAFENQFEAVPDDPRLPFRLARTAARPAVHGVLNAFVDGEFGDGVADLDESGRYKVRLPTFLSNAGAGKASCRVRMASPYAGTKHGLHFPLLKGAEVLLTHVDGDPDRPIIASAIPNDACPSPVTDGNPRFNVLRSAGQNLFEMEDTSGSERIVLQSPNAGSFLVLGKAPEPKPAAAASPAPVAAPAAGAPGAASGGGGGAAGGPYDLTARANRFAVAGTGTGESTIDAENGDLSLHAKKKIKTTCDELETTVGGDWKETVTGDTERTVVGTVKDLVKGNVSTVFGGTRQSVQVGNTLGVFGGTQEIVDTAGKFVISSASKVGLWAGKKVALKLAKKGLSAASHKLCGKTTTIATGIDMKAIALISLDTAGVFTVKAGAGASVAGGTVGLLAASACTISAPVINITAATAMNLQAPTLNLIGGSSLWTLGPSGLVQQAPTTVMT